MPNLWSTLQLFQNLYTILIWHFLFHSSCHMIFEWKEDYGTTKFYVNFSTFSLFLTPTLYLYFSWAVGTKFNQSNKKTQSFIHDGTKGIKNKNKTKQKKVRPASLSSLFFFCFYAFSSIRNETFGLFITFPWGLSTLAKELSAAARIMQSFSKELSTLVADRV